eukprot:14755564-Heterocapsa_arctica.AAC.1
MAIGRPAVRSFSKTQGVFGWLSNPICWFVWFSKSGWSRDSPFWGDFSFQGVDLLGPACEDEEIASGRLAMRAII